MAKALTDIRHGTNDGGIVTFDQGDDVTGLDRDVMEYLREIGAVGDEDDLEAATTGPSPTAEAELEAARARIAELEAQLAEDEEEDTSPPPLKLP